MGHLKKLNDANSISIKRLNTWRVNLRTRLCKLCEDHKHLEKLYTVQNFLEEDLLKRTIYQQYYPTIYEKGLPD